MSLVPINVGSAGSGSIKLQPGWKLTINDFNMDVLTCSLLGSFNDIMARTPDKYEGPNNIAFPLMVGNIGNLSCSARDIVPGEGLSALANLEFKGFVKTPRDPVVSLAWMSAVANIGGTNFMVPTQAQLTLKFGNISAYKCAVGTSGNPFGSKEVPQVMEVNFVRANGSAGIARVRALTQNWVCTKHDPTEAGKYSEETQVWSKYYVPVE